MNARQRRISLRKFARLVNYTYEEAKRYSAQHVAYMQNIHRNARLDKLDA